MRLYHNLNIYFDDPAISVPANLAAFDQLGIGNVSRHADDYGVHVRVEYPPGTKHSAARANYDQIKAKCMAVGLRCLKTTTNVRKAPPKRLPLKFRKMHGLPLNTPAW